MTVNFLSNVKGKGWFFWSCLFFFNDCLFPSLLKRKLNIISRANASNSFKKPLSERSIPSKIKLTSLRISTGTDSIWLFLPNLKLASVDWHSLSYRCDYVYQWFKNIRNIQNIQDIFFFDNCSHFFSFYKRWFSHAQHAQSWALF